MNSILGKANEFYYNTKIFLWFSNSVDFIFSCAIVYSVIDDLYQLVIRYLRDNNPFSFMQHNPICKIPFAIWIFPVKVLFLYSQMQMSLFWVNASSIGNWFYISVMRDVT